jgi:hypothetical protein
MLNSPFPVKLVDYPEIYSVLPAQLLEVPNLCRKVVFFHPRLEGVALDFLR